MLTRQDIEAMIEEVKCRDFKFRLEEREGGFLVQATAWRPDSDAAPDPVSGLYADGLQKGRKWYVSRHIARTEFIETLFAAVERFEAHELREAFLYRGKPIFSRHIDVNSRVRLIRQGEIDVRENE